MKPYLLYLFILPLLLFALTDESISKGSDHISRLPGAVHTGNVYTGAGFGGKMDMAIAITMAGQNDLQTTVNSGCKNSSNKTKKTCKKRKCLKHPTKDSLPSGGVPATSCSIPLVAVLNQGYEFHFSAPSALSSPPIFHTVIPFSPDLEQDPRPPRYT